MSADQIGALYNREGLAEYFLGVAPRHEHKFAPRIAELPALGLPPRARVLDVGCGSGEFPALADESGYDVVGIDISMPSIRVARELHSGVDYRVADPTTVAADEPAAFDLVTLWDVIEHVLYPHEIVRACSGALRGGGILAVGTPNGDSLYDSLVDVAYKLHWPMADRMLEQRYSDWHLQIWNAATLGRLVREHGFDVVSVRRHRELSARPSAYVAQAGYARTAHLLRAGDPILERLWPIRNKLTLYARKRR